MKSVNLTLGPLLSLLADTLLGTFAWPMKRIKLWQWENARLMHSAWALILVPWTWAFQTVPDLFSVYPTLPFSVLLSIFLFGSGWRIASIGFGIGLNKLGLALGTAIALGLVP